MNGSIEKEHPDHCAPAGPPAEVSETDALLIRYTYEFEDGYRESHEVRLHPETLELCDPVKSDQAQPAGGPPEWARLDNHKCAGCPLTSDAHPHCPAAVALANLSTSFGDRTSYTPVQVTVETPTRTITRQAPLQEALFPLLGLRMATSGCPVLSKLRPMARFHLPFADSEETAYRAISMYLVSQFLRQSKGLPAEFDLNGLAEIYDQVHEVNLTFSKRLAQISSSDANINSLTTLDMFAQDVPFSIETALPSLDQVFSTYLD